MKNIASQARMAVEELIEKANLKAGELLVVGCSSSEIVGSEIGHGSSLEAAEAVFEGIYTVLKEKGIYLAAQCCEHLNRALVMEQATLDDLRLVQVNVMPVPKAGGSVGAAAYKRFSEPAVAVAIQADAAIDVGDTLVGMHVRPVAVPLRMGEGETKVGEAHVVMAYSRLPYIGGPRAQYPEK